MDTVKTCVIIILSLLALFEQSEPKGLCDFAEMFPSKGSESCFQRKAKKEDKGILTVKSANNITTERTFTPNAATPENNNPTSPSASNRISTLNSASDITKERTFASNDAIPETNNPSSPSASKSGVAREGSANASIVQKATPDAVTPQTNGFTVPSIASESFVIFCPTNMEYGNCTCQTTCEDPYNLNGCQTRCSEQESCICREGFLKNGHDCVPPSECGCYIQGKGVIPNNHSYVNFDCTSRCQCHSNVLTCDENYRCSADATCEERDGVRQCYCNDGYTGDGQNCEVVATDCADIYNANITESGVYTIQPTNWPGPPFEVYCNMTDGGGWTVFQRRVDGSENFYRVWNSYKEGFGSPNHELWLGNDKIFYLTNQRNYELRIDLVYGTGRPYYAKYNLFRINDEDDKYRLVGLGKLSGTAGNDVMYFHLNKSFSTHDKDNDGWSDYNCAEKHHGAWWYAKHWIDSDSNCATDEPHCDFWSVKSNSCANCGQTNLNGDYNSVTRGTGIDWESPFEYDCDVVYTEMKVKPV